MNVGLRKLHSTVILIARLSLWSNPSVSIVRLFIKIEIEGNLRHENYTIRLKTNVQENHFYRFLISKFILHCTICSIKALHWRNNIF
jgi:hypothetical protein